MGTMRDLHIGLLFLGGLLLTLATFSWGQRRWRWDTENTRKGTHIVLGLSTLAFPWWFSGPLPVLILAALATCALHLSKRLPSLRYRFGTALFGVARSSHGELYFIAAVALLFTLAHDDPLRYVVPMLILALADAVAALVGTRHGKTFYKSPGGHKSLEGSMAMFLVTFLCTCLPLRHFAGTGLGEGLLVASVVGLFIMTVEGMCGGGSDNLFIPLAAYVVLGPCLSFTGTPSISGV